MFDRQRTKLRSAALDGLGALLNSLYRAGAPSEATKAARFLTISQLVAFVPGYSGVVLRRSWYSRTLQRCGKNLYVDWMAAVKTSKASFGDDVFIGNFSWIAWAELGSDVLIGGHVMVLSGRHHHRTDRTDTPMRRLGTHLEKVRIGDDVWIGEGATIMADVADGTVVGAGAVVNKRFEPCAIIAGVPAHFIRSRSKTDSKPGSVTP